MFCFPFFFCGLCAGRNIHGIIRKQFQPFTGLISRPISNFDIVEARRFLPVFCPDADFEIAVFENVGVGFYSDFVRLIVVGNPDEDAASFVFKFGH